MWLLAACTHPAPSAGSHPRATATSDTAAEPVSPPPSWGDCASASALTLVEGSDSVGLDQIELAPAAGRYLGGWSYGAVTLGADEAATTLIPAGELERLVARYAASGELDWAVALNGSTQAALRALAPLSVGVAVVGSGDGLTTLGSSPPLGGLGESDVYLARLGDDGALLWARSFGSAADDYGNALAALPDDGLLLGGWVGGDAVLGAGEVHETAVLVPDGFDRAAILARYSADGALVWARAVPGASLTAVAYDPAADRIVVVGGLSAGQAVFGEGTRAEVTIEAVGLYVARYDGDGAFLGVATAEGDLIAPMSLDLLPDGAALVSGFQRGSVTFDPAGPPLGSDGLDAFLARYGADGRFEWVTRMAAAADRSVYGRDVAALPDGGALLTGSFGGSVVLDDGEVLTTSDPTAGTDGFLLRVDPAGQVVCAIQLAGVSDPSATYVDPYALRLRADGSVDLVGRLAGTTALDPGAPEEIDATAESGGFLLTITLP